MLILDKHPNFYRLSLLVFGFIVLSPLSLDISELLGSTGSLFELLFLPFYFLYRKKMGIHLKFNKTFLIILYIILLLFLVSILVGNYSLHAVFSTCRAYVYMLLAFNVCYKNKKIKIADVGLICLGSTLAWAFLSIRQILLAANGLLLDSTKMVVYGNMIALSLIISIYIMYKKKYLFIFTIFLVLLISFTAGLRRQIFVSLISLSMAYLFIGMLNVKQFFKSLLVIFPVVFFLIMFFPQIKSSVYEISPLLHSRIFVKIEELITQGGAIEDEGRKENLVEVHEMMYTSYVPKGFVTKQTLTDKDGGRYMDMPILELLYMFGTPLTIIMILTYIYYLCSHIYNYYREKKTSSAIWAILGIVMIFLLFVEGSFISFLYVVPITGYVFSRLFTLTDEEYM